MLHGQGTDVFADAGYQGADKRPDAKPHHKWLVAMRPGKRKKPDKDNHPVDALIDKVERIKASIRAKVEHPFRAPESLQRLRENGKGAVKNAKTTPTRAANQRRSSPTDWNSTA